MKIGFVGYGSMASALGGRWSRKNEIFFGGRDPSKAAKVAATIGAGARHGTSAEAVRFGDVVVLATRHEVVFDAIGEAGGPAAFADRILIDINNPVPNAGAGDFLVHAYDGKSLSEAIAQAVPGARVVKAFNMCQARVWQMDPPLFDGRRLATLYCGDDESAKNVVAQLIAEIGSEPVDLGELRYARLLEPAAAIVIKFLFSGRDARTILNLIQPESKAIA